MIRNAMKIYRSQIHQLPGIVTCHQKSFSASLSAKLGERFTHKMLSWYIYDERGVMLHAEAGNTITGYCCGIIKKRPGLPGASTSVTQFGFFSMTLSFFLRPWLLFHRDMTKRYSFILKNILIKLGMRNAIRPAETDEQFTPSWGLVVIATDPDCRNMGVGGRLLEEFERMAKLDAVETISLSVRKNNPDAIAFYIKRGWSRVISTGDSLIMHKTI